MLKKCKITKSIFNQTTGVNIGILNKYTSLGWVFVDSIKWILLYNSENNDLKRIIYFYNPQVDFCTEENKHYIKFKCYNGKNYLYKNISEAEECERIVFELIELKQITDEKGQFFI